MDGIQLLIHDHNTLRLLFSEAKKVSGSEKKEVLNRIIHEWCLHDFAERQVLYPLLQKMTPDGASLAEKSLEEHAKVSNLSDSLKRKDLDSEEFKNELNEFIDEVSQHTTDEESKVFPLLKKNLSKEELMKMGKLITDIKLSAPSHPSEQPKKMTEAVQGDLSSFLNSASTQSVTG